MKKNLHTPPEKHTARQGYMQWLFGAFIWLAVLCGSGGLKAADLIEILPVTNKIIVVHFDEGHIDYFGVPVGGNYLTGPYESSSWTPISANKKYIEPIDLTAATTASNYKINGQNAVYVGYKGKPAEFDGAMNPVSMEYWMYVSLPITMQSGNSYTITLNNLAGNTNEYTFVYNENSLRSPSIHVNQIGFKPDMKKVAHLSQWMGTYNNGAHQNGGLELDDYVGKSFHIVNAATRQVVRTYTNAITLQKAKGDVYARPKQNVNEAKNERDWTYAEVLACDFSDFTTAGEYCIVVDGMGCSYPFHIGNNVLNEPYYYASKAAYYQRQGIVKRNDWYNNQLWPRAFHPGDGTKYYYDPLIDGTQEYGSSKFGPTQYEMTNAWGHYYDAGDWDHREGHWLLPLACLFAYDLNAANLKDGDVANTFKWAEGDASWVNEGTNGIPDILDEAVWLINWGMRVRKEINDKNFPLKGGIPLYTGVDAGCKTPDFADTRACLVAQTNANATLDLAAAAAYYAYCLQIFNANHGGSVSSTYINKYRDEAIAAYTWGMANNPTSTNTKILAAATLYALTGNDTYQQDFVNNYANAKIWDGFWEPSREFYASSIYLWACKDKPNLNTTHYNYVKSRVLDRAKKVTDPATNNGRGFSLGGLEDGQWADMEQTTTPMVFSMAVMHKITGEQKYKDIMESTVSYMLGGNQQNLVTMSGIGENQELSPFHPTSWYLMDFNSKVYRNPILPGYTPYGRKMTWINLGLELKTRSFAKPTIDSWPFGESRFNNRESIEGSEFTISQTLAPSLLAFAVMKTSDNFTANQRPTLSLNLTEGGSVGYDCTRLTVNASSDTRVVKYYYEWHYIGQSTDKANNFAFDWNISKYNLSVGNTIVITAVAYDDKGLISVPTDGADKTVTIVAGSTCGGTTDTQAPTVPSNLAASNITQTSFTLTWSASSDNVGVTGYEVFQNGVSIGTSSNTSKPVSGLSCGTTYSMTVKARDAAGNWSAASTAKSVTTSACSGGETAFAKINFQPSTAAIPTGYIKDDGSVYGARNGFTYGWSGNNTANTRLRTSGPDQRSNTLNHMMKGGTYTWEIAVPNGDYRVDVLFGDADFTDQTNNVTIEGVAISDPDGQDNFDLYTNVTRTVTDGRLTIAPSGGINVKICYIDIYSASAPDVTAPSVPANLATSNITEDGFTLTWTASTDNVGVTGYEVFQNGVSIGTSSNTSKTVSGLTCGTTYSMTVKARDAAGNWSAASSAKSVTTVACPSVKYRYIRITFLAGNNMEYTETELYENSAKFPQTAYDASAGKNMFDLCTTTASDCKWFIGNSFPASAVLDLGTSVTILPTSVKIYKRTWSTLTSFKVEGSNDNSSWTLIKQVDGISNTVFTGTDPHSATFDISNKAGAMESVADVSTEILIFPNPSSTGDVTLIAPESRCRVISATGALIDEFDMSGIAEVKILTKGTYFVQFIRFNEVDVRKLIVR